MDNEKYDLKPDFNRRSFITNMENNPSSSGYLYIVLYKDSDSPEVSIVNNTAYTSESKAQGVYLQACEYRDIQKEKAKICKSCPFRCLRDINAFYDKYSKELMDEVSDNLHNKDNKRSDINNNTHVRFTMKRYLEDHGCNCGFKHTVTTLEDAARYDKDSTACYCDNYTRVPDYIELSIKKIKLEYSFSEKDGVIINGR